jgi:hypothetical protein
MAETAVWAALRKHLRPKGHIIRIENSTERGTPDVNYCLDGVEGWIELKEIDAWPVRANTCVRLDHYTNYQRIWHQLRSYANGRIHVLIHVPAARQWLMLRGLDAVKALGSCTRERLEELACVNVTGPYPGAQILAELMKDPRTYNGLESKATPYKKQ